MKNIILLLALLASSTLVAQEKGAAPITNHQSPVTSGVTRAVVVGISDYQDEGIPDLRFANRDAEAFANYLRSPAGGSLDGDHLKVLLDKDGTIGQFIAALDWLLEESQEDDQAIIYFSGHGDVESKYRSQPGYLLAWDSPSKSYMAGAFNVRDLQDIVSTMSIDKKVRVTLITDACRSGKLAGSEVGGAQITGASLSKQFANEVKILSCQPNEYSIEGEQWGGGRGAFSYHLIDALYGMADANADGTVTLSEVDRYLETHVTPEVAPMSQVPMTLGNRTERLAQVSPEALAVFTKNKGKGSPIFAAIETRGLEDDVLAAADSSVRRDYRAFKRAVKEHRFFLPKGDCADDLYNRLILENSIARLHGNMKRNYAAALMDEFQQWMNWNLYQDDGVSELNTYDNFRLQIGRAAELLGKEHYMYNKLQSYLLYFKGNFFGWQSDAVQDAAILDSSFAYHAQAVALFPENVLAVLELGNAYRKKQDFQMAFSQYQKAAEMAPYHDHVWSNLTVMYLLFQDFEKAVASYKKTVHLNPDFWIGRLFADPELFNPGFSQLMMAALPVDTTFGPNFSVIGLPHLAAHRFSQAEEFFQKALSKQADDPTALYGMALMRMYERKYPEAEGYFRALNKVGGRRATSAFARCLLAQGKNEDAAAVLQKRIQKFETVKPFPTWYARALMLQTANLPDSARVVIREMKDASSHFYNQLEADFYPLALCRQALVEGKPAEALAALRQVFEILHPKDMNRKWWVMFNIRSDELLDPFSRTPEAAALMAQHLPWK